MYVLLRILAEQSVVLINPKYTLICVSTPNFSKPSKNHKTLN